MHDTVLEVDTGGVGAVVGDALGDAVGNVVGAFVVGTAHDIGDGNDAQLFCSLHSGVGDEAGIWYRGLSQVEPHEKSKFLGAFTSIF